MCKLRSLPGKAVVYPRGIISRYTHLTQGPVKVPALPHGRATEQAAAQVSSPRVSKGCASTQLSYGTLTGPQVKTDRPIGDSQVCYNSIFQYSMKTQLIFAVLLTLVAKNSSLAGPDNGVEFFEAKI